MLDIRRARPRITNNPVIKRVGDPYQGQCDCRWCHRAFSRRTPGLPNTRGILGCMRDQSGPQSPAPLRHHQNSQRCIFWDMPAGPGADHAVGTTQPRPELDGRRSDPFAVEADAAIGLDEIRALPPRRRISLPQPSVPQLRGPSRQTVCGGTRARLRTHAGRWHCRSCISAP